MYKKDNNGLNPDRLENYEVEAEKIIRWLQNDQEFCYDFFFGTNPKMCNMAQLRSSMLAYFKKDYQVELSPMDFSTIVYEALWSEGTWATLKTYNSQSTFFAWLKEVAKNSVLNWLKRDLYISANHSRTTGNTRLALFSKPVEMRQLIIDEQLKGSKFYDLMCSIYVGRLTKVEIMVKYHMTEQEFEQAQDDGERKLKDALLRSSCWYEKEVLRDKTRDNLSVSSEFVADLEEWMLAKLGENSLADVFDVNLTNEEIREKVVDLLYRLSAKMDWNEIDRMLWRQRFIYDTPPVKVAETLGHTRAWVDTRFSKLNKEIKPSIKRWWAAQAA